jgi:hypothetical protein
VLVMLRAARGSAGRVRGPSGFMVVLLSPVEDVCLRVGLLLP